MKLYTSLTSPYGRKCRMAAMVAGVADKIQVTEVDYKSADYRRLNPLGKVPALELTDGSVLIDSPVICAYLAELGRAPGLYPQDADARWSCLALEALADGVTDAGVLAYLEKRREQNPETHAWIHAQSSKIDAGLDALDAAAADFADATHVGALAAAASVAWLQFRSVVPGILDGRPNLAAWLEEFSKSLIMTATAPPPDA